MKKFLERMVFEYDTIMEYMGVQLSDDKMKHNKDVIQ